jgi:hypothetical protein
MQAVDVRSGKQIRKETEFASDDPSDQARAARWLARKVSSPMITTLAKGKGKLQVDCDQTGAELYLNGKSFGNRTGKSFKVGSGVFDVMVKKEGFLTFHDVVVVKPGMKKVVRARLKPEGETRPVEVAATTDTQPETPAPVEPKEKKPADLPAWAVFEKPKPKALETPKKEDKPEKKSATLMPWQKKVTEPKPYLPSPKKEEPVQEEEKEDDSAFYETWWFWTIIGAGVAAGAGTAVYFTVFAEEESAGVGTALVRWE